MTTNALFKRKRLEILILLGCYLLLAAACTPTVQVAPPTEPITINLNVKIEHEIRIKVERELEELFDEDSELF
jgi:hypothetical protein